MSKIIELRGRKLYKLNSVGSYLDMENALIYPIFEDENPDFTFEINLADEEVGADWFEGLSKEDAKLVGKSLENTKWI